MVAGIRSYLAAPGLNVAAQVDQRALILSSEQQHLIHGNFDVASMLAMLEEVVNGALNDGYVGLWATGDMGWDFGDEKNFDKLLEYEYGLEQIFRRFPQLSGVCQYHQGALPMDAVRIGSMRIHLFSLTKRSGVAPKSETGVKTHFSLNGELSHERFSKKVHQGVQTGGGAPSGNGGFDGRGGPSL